jgi:hypothetical protein
MNTISQSQIKHVTRSILYVKPNLINMKEIYITGFSNLSKLIEVLNNDSNIEDYTYECESRGECDETHEYYIQVIYIEV